MFALTRQLPHCEYSHVVEPESYLWVLRGVPSQKLDEQMGTKITRARTWNLPMMQVSLQVALHIAIAAKEEAASWFLDFCFVIPLAEDSAAMDQGCLYCFKLLALWKLVKWQWKTNKIWSLPHPSQRTLHCRVVIPKTLTQIKWILWPHNKWKVTQKCCDSHRQFSLEGGTSIYHCPSLLLNWFICCLP